MWVVPRKLWGLRQTPSGRGKKASHLQAQSWNHPLFCTRYLQPFETNIVHHNQKLIMMKRKVTTQRTIQDMIKDQSHRFTNFNFIKNISCAPE